MEWRQDYPKACALIFIIRTIAANAAGWTWDTLPHCWGGLADIPKLTGCIDQVADSHGLHVVPKVPTAI